MNQCRLLLTEEIEHKKDVPAIVPDDVAALNEELINWLFRLTSEELAWVDAFV